MKHTIQGTCLPQHAFLLSYLTHIFLEIYDILNSSHCLFICLLLIWHNLDSNFSGAHLGLYICPIDSPFRDIKVKCRGLFNPCQRNGHIVAVGTQRDAPDVVPVDKKSVRQSFF